MSDVFRAEFAELLSHLPDVKKTLFGKDSIVGFYRMSFAHDEVVAVWIILILRGNVHLIKI